MKGKLSHKNRVVTHTDIQRHFPSIMLGSKVLPYATTVQKTRLSDPCQTSFNVWQHCIQAYLLRENAPLPIHSGNQGIQFKVPTLWHSYIVLSGYNIKATHQMVQSVILYDLYTYIYYRRTDYSFRPELFFSSFFKVVCTLSLFVCLSTNFWYSQRFSSVWT